MNLVVSPSLKWLIPYLLAVNVSNIERLRRITAVKPKPFQRQLAVAALHQRGQTFTMSIHTHSWHYDIIDGKLANPELLPYSKIEIIEALAHELGHLDHSIYRGDLWTLHTPNHTLRSAEFLVQFAVLLLQSGYVSAEHEYQSSL